MMTYSDDIVTYNDDIVTYSDDIVTCSDAQNNVYGSDICDGRTRHQRQNPKMHATLNIETVTFQCCVQLSTFCTQFSNIA